jgi:para-aminobenzoate synthetase/4-amino-4-deoxychorismate lyase
VAVDDPIQGDRGDNRAVSALPVSVRPALFRAPLASGVPLGAALRCLHDTVRPFALVGSWAGGGAIMGCSPVRIAGENEDPFALLAGGGRDSGSEPGVGGGWIGYLGYGLRRRVERVQPDPPRTGAMPAFVLAYYDQLVRLDASGTWWFEALWSDQRAEGLEERMSWWAEQLADPPPRRAAGTSGWRLTPTRRGHGRMVTACRERIYAGDLYQANVCAQLEGGVEGPPLELFIRGVEALTPDRAAFLHGPGGSVVSLSPELFLQRRGPQVRSAPIKGTRRRPPEPDLAARERSSLAGSSKDKAENVMIVDLMRNDLGRVCQPGTVVAEPLAEVRGHVGVWHLVSEIRGMLRAEVDDGELLRATFPPGSVTGAPKIAAINVISELESTAREVYTGAIGIASPMSGLELSVAIRTFEISGSRIRLGVGGGVVADSDSEDEAAEITVKLAPLLDALGATGAVAAGAAGRAPRMHRTGPVPLPRPDPLTGVFETLLVEDGRVVELELHLRRLGASVAALYQALLPASLPGEVEAIARGAHRRSRLRIDARPGPPNEVRVNLGIRPLSAAGPVHLRAWTLPGGLGPHKWSDRRLIEAAEATCPGELPLLVDADGGVLETTRSNVFALGRDGVLRTPPDDGRILPGVARARVLAAAQELGHETVVGPLWLEDLVRASVVMVTSALRRSPVTSLDGRQLAQHADLTALLVGAG